MAFLLMSTPTMFQMFGRERNRSQVPAPVSQPNSKTLIVPCCLRVVAASGPGSARRSLSSPGSYLLRRSGTQTMPSNRQKRLVAGGPDRFFDVAAVHLDRHERHFPLYWKFVAYDR